MQKLTFLSSSNFWTAVVLALGGLFVGFPEDAARETVANIFALLGSGKLLHEYFKTQQPAVDAEAAVNRSNWWNYVAVVVTSVLPKLPATFVDSLQDVMTNLLSTNWQGVIISLFSLATILFNLFMSKRKVPTIA